MQRYKTPDVRRQIAKAERERLEQAFITLFCWLGGLTREQFDSMWVHGLGEADTSALRRLAPGRDWEWDFVAPHSRIVVEVNGGQWLGQNGGAERGKSGHASGTALQRDAEKQNAAVFLGWKPFVFTTSMLDARDPVMVAALVQWMRVPMHWPGMSLSRADEAALMLGRKTEAEVAVPSLMVPSAVQLLERGRAASPDVGRHAGGT